MPLLSRTMHFGHFAMEGDCVPPQIAYCLWVIIGKAASFDQITAEKWFKMNSRTSLPNGK